MGTQTDYSILVIFENGLKKRWGLQTAMSTFRYWDQNIKPFMPDNQSLKDARKILKIARKHFPKQTHKIIEIITTTEFLDY